MGTAFARPSFASGEIDPDIQGRVDVDRFHTGLARCENWRVKPSGSLENRSGHRFVGRAKYGDRRTIGWKFKRDASNNYTIEVGHLYFRFWKDRRPVMQDPATASADMLHLLGGAFLWVASSTPGLWYLTAAVGGPPSIYGAPQTVKRYEASVEDIELPAQTIDSIADGWAWGDRDDLGYSTLYVADSSADLNDEGVTGHRIAIPGQLEVTHPYLDVDLMGLRQEASGDILFIVSSKYPPAQLQRFGDFDWRYSELDFNGQTAPVDDYGFVSGFSLPSPPSNPEYVIQYMVTRLGTDGNESEGRSIYVVANDLPDSSTPPPIGTLGPAWTLESTEQGDARNIIIDPTEYEWINAYTYSGANTWQYETPSGPSGPVTFWFLARKGTGLDGPGAGGTNLAQDPDIFADVDQVGPIALYDITDIDNVSAVTRHRKDGVGIPSGSNGWNDLGEWAFGISAEIRYGSAFYFDTGIVNFPTLWIMAGEWVGVTPVPVPSSRRFEMTLEVDAGYNLYRRYAKITGVDGQAQGGSWFPWGRLAAVDAYGGTLRAAPARSPYVDPETLISRVYGAFKDIAQILPDETIEPPSVLLDFDQPEKYPDAIGFVGQRLLLAGSDEKPNRLRASATGEFFNFNTPQTLKDADPIDRSLTTTNRIRFVIEVGNGSAIIFTVGSEWRFWGEGGVISPLTINVVPISEYGCLDVKPIKVGSRVLYLTELGKTLNGIGFDLAQDNFTSRDLSSMSGHLVEESQVIALDYAATPDKTVWAVREDGTAIGITFDEDQQMNAWHRHSTARGTYVWVHTTRIGRFDDVWFLVRRTINGEAVQYFEALDVRDWTRHEQACVVDCSVSLEQPSIAASNLRMLGLYSVVTCADWEDFAADDEVMLSGLTGDPANVFNGYRVKIGPAVLAGGLELVTISTGEPIDLTAFGDSIEQSFSIRKLVTRLWGLDHLEGETVAVLGDGRDLGDYVVDGGKIDLEIGVADAVVGLAIDGKVDTLPFTGAAGTDTLNHTKRNVDALHVHFRNSAGVEMGLLEDELTAFRPDDVENPNLPAPLVTGTQTVVPLGSWGDGRLYIRTRRPFPAQILSLTPEYSVGAR